MPTVIPEDAADRRRLAAELMRAAEPDRHRVRLVTAGGSAAFDVPDDVFEQFVAAGGDAEVDEQPAGSDGNPDTGPGDSPLPTGDFAPADPPVVSGEPLVPVADGDAPTDEAGPAEPAADDVEVPERSGKTADWREFMRPQLGDKVDDMNRAALIAAYDERTDNDA